MSCDDGAPAFTACKTHKPYWENKDIPGYFTRSSVKYDSISIKELRKNGITSQRLDDILTFLPDGAYIAGGFLRAMIAGEDEMMGDIDFFFNGLKPFEEMLSILNKPISGKMEKVFGGYKTADKISAQFLVEKTSNFKLINYNHVDKSKPPIQLIKLIWFDNPEHVIDSFDFTVSQFVVDGEKLYFNPQALDDLETKTLRLHRVNCPNGIIALNRIMKYAAKGYNADPTRFKEVVDSAAEMILGADDEKMPGYFYFNGKKIEPLEKEFLGKAWKYLQESKHAPMIFAKIFGSKEKVAEELQQSVENEEAQVKKTLDNLF